MKKLKLSILFTLILGIIFIPNLVHAASFSVSASSYNVSVGSSVTVYVKGTDLAGKFTISSSNSSVFSGGGSVWVDKDTQSVRFTAKSSGSVTITVTPTNVSDYSGNQITGSKSIILKSYVPRQLETDNYLSSLSVDGAELIPSFDKDTDTYIVDLEPGTTKININAEKANRYASVSGTGEIEVVEGNNDIEVVVTAENGSKRTYHITAVVKEFDPIKKTVNGSDYTVVRKLSELTKPDNYEETTVEIDGNQVPAFYNKTVGYTLIGMKDVTGAIKMFIYDNGNFIPYLALSFNKLDLVILEADNIPKGFVKDTITINDEIVTCYKNNELNIILLYGKSITTGESNFYAFENTDFTIQKFNIDSYKLVNDKIKLYTYIIIGLGVLNLLILLCLIISIVKNKKKLKHDKVELEKTLNVDITAVKKASELSKKELKKLEKKKKKEEEKQRIIEEQKQETLKEAEEEQKRLELKKQKELAKKEKKNKKKNKKSSENDDDMYLL